MLQKNSNLIENICEVQIKSAHGSMFPVVAPIYTSLSQIKWSFKSGTTNEGTLYKNKLEISYPGLNEDQFNELDKFIKGLYEVIVVTALGKKYELAGSNNPMEVEIDFNGGKTGIDFNNVAFEPIKYLGNIIDEAEPLGFPYNLTFTLA